MQLAFTHSSVAHVTLTDLFQHLLVLWCFDEIQGHTTWVVLTALAARELSVLATPGLC